MNKQINSNKNSNGNNSNRSTNNSKKNSNGNNSNKSTNDNNSNDGQESMDEFEVTDFKYYFLEALKNTLVGFLFGILIDKFFNIIYKKYKINVIVIIILQILTLIIFLWVIRKYIIPHEGSLWQRTTSGILFASFYFGSQIKLFGYIYEEMERWGW